MQYPLWLRRSAAGDRLAFEQLYQYSSPHLFALCLRILRRKDLAEETLHDAYLKIWNKAAEYQEQKGSALAWMATVTRYSALDMLRKLRKEPLAPEEPVADLSPSSDPDGLELLSRKQEGQALQHCLGELSPEQREGIMLAFWRGLSHQDLAQQMKKPLGTVKSWVRRGLERLKRCLES